MWYTLRSLDIVGKNYHDIPNDLKDQINTHFNTLAQVESSPLQMSLLEHFRHPLVSEYPFHCIC